MTTRHPLFAARLGQPELLQPWGHIGRAVMGYGSIDPTGEMAKPGFLVSLLLSVVGAIALLAGYRLIKGRSLRA